MISEQKPLSLFKLFKIAVCCVFGMGVLLYYTEPQGQTNEVVDGIPACDSEWSIDGIKQVIEDNAYSNVVKIELLDWSNVIEASYNEKDYIRKCVADVTLNIGNKTLYYILKRSNSDPTQVIIQTRLLELIDGIQLRDRVADGLDY